MNGRLSAVYHSLRGAREQSLVVPPNPQKNCDRLKKKKYEGLELGKRRGEGSRYCNTKPPRRAYQGYHCSTRRCVPRMAKRDVLCEIQSVLDVLRRNDRFAEPTERSQVKTRRRINADVCMHDGPGSVLQRDT